jgi:hypothetical protein
MAKNKDGLEAGVRIEINDYLKVVAENRVKAKAEKMADEKRYAKPDSQQFRAFHVQKKRKKRKEAQEP